MSDLFVIELSDSPVCDRIMEIKKAVGDFKAGKIRKSTSS